jgi:hypothetical protein
VISARRHGLRLDAWDVMSQPFVRVRMYRVGLDGGGRARKVILSVMGDPEMDRALHHREAAGDGQAGGRQDGRDLLAAGVSFPQWLDVMRAGFEQELGEELERSGGTGSADAAGFEALVKGLQGADGDEALIFAAPRGLGISGWGPSLKRQIQIRRRYMLLGQTLEGMRVWDIGQAARALGTMEAFKGLPVTLRGRGDMGCNVLYAALIGEGVDGVTEVALWDLPASHRSGPDYLNVMRFLDVPQAVAMVAERMRVRVSGAGEEAWRYAAAVAGALGWDADRVVAE